MKNKELLVDILILILLIFLASLYAYLTQNIFIGKSLFVGFIFTVPPTIYLGLRKKKNWKKIFSAVLLFGLIFGFVFSFIAEYTSSWQVVSTIFPMKLFGFNTFDTTLGIALMTLLTVTFYEHFIEKRISGKISKKFWLALIPSLFVIVLLIGIYLINPEILQTKYPYFYMGIIAILPVFYLAIKNPKLISKMAVTTIYFFFLYFVIEIFAVKYNYWIYSGNNYIGWVNFFNITFPFEELFFWMLFYAASIVSYYEILIDDEK
jgi:hypothetical protein